MQNVDFSKHVKRPEYNSAASESYRGTGDSANRCYFFALVVSLLFFSGGVYAGFQLHRVQHIEENLVRYPDHEEESAESSTGENQESTTSFANIASGGGRQSIGEYVIYLGAHEPRRAARMAGELNGLPGLRGATTLPCKNMEEENPDRPPVFRTGSSNGDGRQDVYAGCFADQESGQAALEEIRQSSAPGAAEARLFTIR